MDLRAIRSTVIKALFSDDLLMEKLVLKGGNAIDIGYNLSARASSDVDFSIEDDFDDLEDIRARILRSLSDRFDSLGLHVFDLTLDPKPRAPRDPKWGGYRVLFKLIDRKKASLDEESRRRQALILDGQSSKFRIEISKYEFTDGFEEHELEHFPIRIYSPQMMTIEKLRALCQQMPQGGRGEATTPRARDFFDIHQLITRFSIGLATQSNQILIRKIFSAKEVPVTLLWTLPEYRDFHALDWPAVEATVSGKIEKFDFYFEFVCLEVAHLKSNWVE